MSRPGKSAADQAEKTWRERLRAYADPRQAREWLEENWERVRALFEIDRVRDWVFEPVLGAWRSAEPTTDDRVRAIITQVAVANAAIAGLPGKLGVGVFVSMALEAYMAIAIGRRIGVEIERPQDIWKYFGLLGGIAATILWFFRHLLGLAFSLFNLVPILPATVLAEFVVTGFVGAVFWTTFEEVKENRSFAIPLRATGRLGRHLRDLLGYQRRVLADSLSLENLKRVGGRLRDWFTGDALPEPASVRGDIFCAAALGWLLMGRYDELRGPLAQVFLQAIRDRFPDLKDASTVSIADFMRARYNEDQMEGVVNLVKGRMFERLVELHENTDGDEWTARLHDDPSYPGSDIVFTDASGDQIEVSLKATDSASYVENALLKYPDIPILTTEELGTEFEDLDMVIASDFSNQSLIEVTEENFDQLLKEVGGMGAAETAGAVGAGTAVDAAASLWPFAVAYMRGRISAERVKVACAAILPEAGGKVGTRLVLGAILGPIYAWYLLARLAMKATPGASPGTTPLQRPRRLVYGPRLE